MFYWFEKLEHLSFALLHIQWVLFKYKTLKKKKLTKIMTPSAQWGCRKFFLMWKLYKHVNFEVIALSGLGNTDPHDEKSPKKS